MPKPKKFSIESEYDTSIGCTACKASIHENMLVWVSKQAVRCPFCQKIFKPGEQVPVSSATAANLH